MLKFFGGWMSLTAFGLDADLDGCSAVEMEGNGRRARDAMNGGRLRCCCERNIGRDFWASAPNDSANGEETRGRETDSGAATGDIAGG